MRTFFATLFALLAAMAIAFGFWKHEEWVRAKNECLNAIHLAYEYANSSTTTSLDVAEAELNAGRQNATIAARRLIEIFKAKRLPLSAQDRRDFAYASKIVDDWDFKGEEKTLLLAIMHAETADKARQLRKSAYESARKHNRLNADLQSNIEFFFHANKHVDSADDVSRPGEEEERPVAAAIKTERKLSTTPSPTPTSTATPSPTVARRNPEIITLTQRVSINVPYGIIGLSAGTQLKMISRSGNSARVQYDGAEYDIPISAPDLK